MAASVGAASVGCIVVAAGSGSRLGADRPKAFVDLDGVPVLVHAVRRVLAGGAAHVVAVVPPAFYDEAATLVAGLTAPTSPPVQVVVGGARRQDSVAAGLAALPHDVVTVLVHDAARCLAPPSLVASVIGAVRAGAAAVLPGLPVTDTVKEVAPGGPQGQEVVVRTVDREPLRAVQTPQGFRREVLQRAHDQARQDEVAVGATNAGRHGGASMTTPPVPVHTDDASMVEQLGEPVVIIAGDPLALKITNPADLDRARWLLTCSGR